MTTRREFMTAAGAATVVGFTANAHSLEPIRRVNPRIRGLSLTAYSLKRHMKWWWGKVKDDNTLDILGFLDYCANLELDGAELTSYFFETPITTVRLNQIKRRAHVLGLEITGAAMSNTSVKEQISKGSFGRLTRIRHSNCHMGGMEDWFVDKEWSWMTDPEQAGFGAFGDLGTHSLDLILWMADRDVARVTASVHTAMARFGKDCDEFGEGMLVFEGGIVGSVAASWVDISNPVVFQINGMEGNAYLVDGKFFFNSKHVDGADGKEPWTRLPPAWPHAFDIFLDAVGGKPYPALVSAHEAALNSAIMEAFYQSAQQQSWVEPMNVKSKRS